MSLEGEQVLLRVYLRSADRPPFAPTEERLVKAARKAGLSGATVLHGILGYGDHGMAKPKPLALIEHVPVIVEVVDSPERIQRFMSGPMNEIMVGGMVTLERASVMMYRQRKHDQPNRFKLAAPHRPLSTIPSFQPGGRMTINEDGILLRVFIGESDRHGGKSLHEAILQKARELGLAGATVLRGVEGFGANSVVHRAALLEMSTDLPVLVEIVDQKQKIELLLPHLEQMVKEGMITMEYVAIVLYRHDPADVPTATTD